MIVRISGERGVAVANEGDDWFVVHEPDYTRLEKSRFSSAMRLLDGAQDVVELEISDPTTIEYELARHRAQDTALQYLLVLLEEDRIGELEERMLERLKKLLLYPGVPEFVERRLYASPLPAKARNRAVAVRNLNAQHPVSKILSRVLDRQERIRDVRAAWESETVGRFRSTQEKDEYFSSAVRTGLVQRLADDTESVLRDDSPVTDGSTFVRDWVLASRIAPVASDCRMELLTAAAQTGSPQRVLELAGQLFSPLLGAITITAHESGRASGRTAEFPGRRFGWFKHSELLTANDPNDPDLEMFSIGDGATALVKCWRGPAGHSHLEARVTGWPNGKPQPAVVLIPIHGANEGTLKWGTGPGEPELVADLSIGTYVVAFLSLDEIPALAH